MSYQSLPISPKNNDSQRILRKKRINRYLENRSIFSTKLEFKDLFHKFMQPRNQEEQYSNIQSLTNDDSQNQSIGKGRNQTLQIPDSQNIYHTIDQSRRHSQSLIEQSNIDSDNQSTTNFTEAPSKNSFVPFMQERNYLGKLYRGDLISQNKNLSQPRLSKDPSIQQSPYNEIKINDQDINLEPNFQKNRLRNSSLLQSGLRSKQNELSVDYNISIIQQPDVSETVQPLLKSRNFNEVSSKTRLSNKISLLKLNSISSTKQSQSQFDKLKHFDDFLYSDYQAIVTKILEKKNKRKLHHHTFSQQKDKIQDSRNNLTQSQISSPSPGQYEWDKSFETSIKTRKSVMVDFSKYIQNLIQSTTFCHNLNKIKDFVGLQKINLKIIKLFVEIVKIKVLKERKQSQILQIFLLFLSIKLKVKIFLFQIDFPIFKLYDRLIFLKFFTVQIDRQKNDMFSPDKSYDLPYRHRLGISIDLEVNNPLIQNVKSGVAFEKRVDREKVSFLRNINKQLSVQEQEQLDMRKERQTNVLSSLSQLDAHQFQNINKFEVRQQEKQKREIQTVLPQLDNTLQQSKQVKRNIKRFLRHTYKMTEDVLKKQIKSQIK